MNISPHQAAEALREVAQTESRSRVLRGYQQGSPYFFLWGVIWTLGYLGTAYAQEAGWDWQIGAGWAALGVTGIVGTIMIGRAQNRALVGASAEELERVSHVGRKWGLGWLVLMIFWVATYAVLQPHEPNQFGAFPAILMGTIYSIAGVLWLPRYLVLGIFITGLTLIGYFYLAPWFALWMAAVGGGGMIVGGLWLRKV